LVAALTLLDGLAWMLGFAVVALLFGDGVRFIRQFGKPPGAAE
jgi:hypothetical protein